MPLAPISPTVTLNYTISGPSTGQWIVLINGLADDLTTWPANIPSFTAAGYQILAYDNRGIGHSSRPPGPYTADMMAEDLHLLLLYLDISKFHLLGVSMGGMIAQSYALSYPNGSPAANGREMRSLSLCCTYSYPSLFCSRMFSFWADVAERMSVPDVMRDVILWAYTVPFFTDPERKADVEAVEQSVWWFDMDLYAYKSQLHVICYFDSKGALVGLRDDGKRLGGLAEGRVMVLAGEEDILIPVCLSRELSEALPGSVWKTTRGGHACLVRRFCILSKVRKPLFADTAQWEFPTEFNNAVLDFLGTLPA